MGYIQFDKIAVPEDNLVSLGLLHRQLQKQRQNECSLENWNNTASKQPLQTQQHHYDPVDDLEDTTTLVPSSVSPDDRSLLTGLSPTFESLAEIWADIMNANDEKDHHDHDHENKGLVSNLQGFPFKSANTIVEHRNTNTKTNTNNKNNNNNDNNNTNNSNDTRSETALTNATLMKPSLDEVVLGTQFHAKQFEDLDLLSPYTTGQDVSTASTTTSKAPSTPKETPAFECQQCFASFKVKGYLTRHLRKHQAVKDFQCPFWAADCQCHTTGAFSRKDTYKTHLKAIHFVYPVGMTRSLRNRSKGRCAACFQEFSNNTEWLDQHVSTGSCESLIRVKKESQD
ncbi:LAFA_0G17018g1_1 [Lachancea sp. 'fantastica']|nr:LAFA_0G17018g1_1 [Lachancea sp. 'fantastica']